MKVAKRYIILAISVALFVSLAGCRREPEITVSHTPPSPFSIEISEDVEDLKSEIVSQLIFANNASRMVSLSDFAFDGVIQIDESNAAYFSYLDNDVASLSEFYFIDVNIDGFELTDIWITPYDFVYVFRCIENPWSPTVWINIRRLEYPLNPDEAWQAVTAQVLRDPRGGVVTADGMLYLARINSLEARVGNTNFNIRVPDRLNNYEFMRDLALEVIATAELVDIYNHVPPQAPNQLTLHFYGRPDAPVVIPVEIGQPLCPVTVADITRRVYGEGPHDRNDGWAFWGWFTDAQLNSSGRTRNGYRRPTVGDVGFDIGAVMTGAMLNSLPATNGNVDLYAVWARWGDVDDDGWVTLVDHNMLFQYARGAMPVPVMVRAAGKVTRDTHITLIDANVLFQYARGAFPLPILGQRPIAPASAPRSMGEVRFEVSHESGTFGDYVLMRVSVAENGAVGFDSALLEIQFDTDALEFVNYRSGNYGIKGMESPWATHAPAPLQDESIVRFGWMQSIDSTEPYMDTGLYVEFVFRIRDNAPVGASDINLIVPTVGGVTGFGGFYSVPFELVPGSVTVYN